MTITVTVDLETHVCGKCSGTYALTTEYCRIKREKGGYWNCPYCQTSWGWNKDNSEIERLRRERDRLKQRNAQKNDEIATLQRSRIAMKGVATRLRKRAAAGVCPCCKRTFKQLAAHMAGQHPGYVESKAG